MCDGCPGRRCDNNRAIFSSTHDVVIRRQIQRSSHRNCLSQIILWNQHSPSLFASTVMQQTATGAIAIRSHSSRKTKLHTVNAQLLHTVVKRSDFTLTRQSIRPHGFMGISQQSAQLHDTTGGIPAILQLRLLQSLNSTKF